MESTRISTMTYLVSLALLMPNPILADLDSNKSGAEFDSIQSKVRTLVHKLMNSHIFQKEMDKSSNPATQIQGSSMVPTTTERDYVVAFQPYTTPTPLPKKPDWSKQQWLEYFKDNHPNIWMKRNQQLQDNKSVKQEMQPSDKTGPKSPYVVQNITNSPLLSGGSDYMTLRESPSQLLLTRTRKKPSNPKGNRLSSIGFNPEQLLIRYNIGSISDTASMNRPTGEEKEFFSKLTSTTTTTASTTKTTTTTTTITTKPNSDVFYFENELAESELRSIEDCTSVDCLRQKLVNQTEVLESGLLEVSKSGAGEVLRPSDPRISKIITSLTTLLDVLNATRAKGSTDTKENIITKLAPRKDQYSKLPTRDNNDLQNRSDVKHGSSKISRDMVNKLLKRLKTLRMKVHPIAKNKKILSHYLPSPSETVSFNLQSSETNGVKRFGFEKPSQTDLLTSSVFVQKLLTDKTTTRPSDEESVQNRFSDLLEVRQKFAPLAFNPTLKPKKKIPQHLIPLGPDGLPLTDKFGEHITKKSTTNHVGMQSEVELPEENGNEEGSYIVKESDKTAIEEDEEEEGGFLYNMMNVVRNMPFETRRQMFASMVFTVPMAAMTLTTLGVPSLMVAPLATVIPGFMFAAFHSDGAANGNSGSASHPAGGGGLSRLAAAANELRTRIRVAELGLGGLNETQMADMMSMIETASSSTPLRRGGILSRIFDFIGR